MTYLEPYQNRKLHENTTSPPAKISGNVNSGELLFQPHAFEAGGEYAGHLGRYQAGGGHDSMAGDGPAALRQAHQDVIDPDQVLNGSASHLNVYSSDRPAFGNLRPD